MIRLHHAHSWLPLCALFCVTLGVANPLVENATATQFIPLSGNIAWDVSGDGSTVVGNTGTSGFRWTVPHGFQLLIGLQTADGVSAGGAKIAGQSSVNPAIPAIWTQETGAQLLSALPNTSSSVVRGISGNGQVVVGYRLPTTGPTTAFRWDATTGMESISVVLGGVDAANAVSEDGTIIVGVDGGSAFKWTRASGLTRIGIGASAAWGVTSDGSIIIGNSGGQAVRWTQSGGMQALDDPSGGDFASSAWDITPDGKFIVGDWHTDHGVEAVLWTQSAGLQTLTDILSQNGIVLNGWLLNSARGISDDGQVIVGGGTNPLGQSQAWVVILPEPSTLSILFTATSLRFSRRRRRPRNHE